MKSTSCLSFLMLLVMPFSTLLAQEQIPDSTDQSSWKKGGKGSMNFSQAQYGRNWAQGGEISISVLSELTGFLNYSEEKLKWKNEFILELGGLKSTAQDNEFRKNADRFEINSKLGYKAFSYWKYSAMVNYKTQVLHDYDYSDVDSVPDKLTSSFNSPGYILFSVGIDYDRYENLSLMVSPVTSKITMVSNKKVDGEAYGLEPGKNIRYELGAYAKLAYAWDITEDISWENKLDIFTNYLENPGKIDVDYQTKAFLKINKYLVTTLSFQLI